MGRNARLYDGLSRARWLVLPPALLVLACSCLDPPSPTAGSTFPVVVTVQRDGKAPLADAQILEGPTRLGTTDATGRVRLELSGAEGSSVALDVKCPEGFASPQRPLSVGLRRLAPGSPAPRFDAECVPLLHSIVTGVRTENGQRMPILHLNRVVGHTDELGVGHVLLEASEHEQITLTLDTRQHPNVLPQSPALTFIAPEQEALVLLEQKFTVKKPPPPPRKRPNPGPRRL